MVELSIRLLYGSWPPSDPLSSFELEIRVEQEQSTIGTKMQQSVPIVCRLGTDTEAITQLHFHGGQSNKLRGLIASQDQDVCALCTADKSRKFPIKAILLSL